MTWKAKWLLLLVPLLSACGWIPLPERSQPDFYFINVLGGQRYPYGTVSYMNLNQLDFVKDLPTLPLQHVQADADLIYQGRAASVHLQIYAASRRPECPASSSGYANMSDVLLCYGPNNGYIVGEVVLRPGQPTPVHLEGAVMDEAARQGTLYLGLALLEGAPAIGERVDVTHIRLNARL